MLIRLLSRRSTLWVLLALTIMLPLTFQAIGFYWQFTLLDQLVSASESREVVRAMTPEQRHVHLLTTTTLDVVFPLILGGLIAGLIGRSVCLSQADEGVKGPRLSKWLLLPVLAVAMDFAEGVVQILALLQWADWLVLKPLFTSAKGVFYALGVLVGSCLLLLARKNSPAA